MSSSATASKGVAVITGSTGGIGKEVVGVLIQEGWSLVLANRSPDKSTTQIDELKKEFPEARYGS